MKNNSQRLSPLPCPRPIAARVAGTLGFLVALGLVAGCGGGEKGPNSGAKNEVSGKVTLGVKPVAGQVVFVFSGGKEVSAPITGDGTYTLPDAPLGTARVYIRAMGGPVGPKGGPEMPKEGPGGSGAAPPPKYQSAATSGLTFEVKAGKQTYDIPLG